MPSDLSHDLLARLVLNLESTEQALKVGDLEKANTFCGEHSRILNRLVEIDLWHDTGTLPILQKALAGIDAVTQEILRQQDSVRNQLSELQLKRHQIAAYTKNR